MLKPVYTSESEIPEDLRQHYEKRGDKWFLALDPSSGYDIVNDGLRRALEETRAEREDAKRKAAQLEAKLGDIQKRLEAAEQRRDTNPSKANEQAVAALKAELDAKLKQIAEQRDRFRAAYSETLLDSTLTDAISRHQGYPERLRPFLREAVRVEIGEDGKAQVIVVDPQSGKPRISRKSDTAEPMSVEELVDEIKASGEYDWAFRAANSKGSGSAGIEGGGGGAGGKVRATWDDVREGRVDPSALAAGKVEVVDQ